MKTANSNIKIDKTKVKICFLFLFPIIPPLLNSLKIRYLHFTSKWYNDLARNIISNKEEFMKTLKLIKVVSLMVVCFMMANVVLSPFAQAQTSTILDGNETRTVEAFQIVTNEKNEEGLYVQNGHMYVNAITTIIESGDIIITKQEILEDYYNLDGDYIKTLAKKLIYQNNYETGEAVESETIKEFDYPRTIESTVNEYGILINSDFISSNVLQFTRDMYSKPKNTQGVTYEDLKQIKATVEELKISNQTQCSHMCAGAFDNYYNYFPTTGDFRIQALSAVAHRYHGYEGSILDSDLNWKTLQQFMGYIDNYEKALIDDMEYNDYALVFEWLLVIAGLVVFFQGFSPGPGGWALFATTVGALSVFRDLTSISYGTNQRLRYSQVAMENLESAQEIIVRSGQRFDFDKVRYFWNVPGY